MCLAIPGKVLSIDPAVDPMMGRVDFGGVVKNICLEWVSDIHVDDYVLVHVGFALSKVDEAEALQTLSLLREMGSALEELQEGEQPVSDM